MKEKLVSVVVPVYNAEKYLESSMNSVLNQSYKNIELILVNDGSNKETHDLCDGLKKQDNRVKVIHKKNGGAASARNTGINWATGEFLLFLFAKLQKRPRLL